MFFLLILSFLLPAPAHSARKCGWSDDGSFYGAYCDAMGIRNSTGRTVAAIGEILRVNPASLPTLPTPLGAEFNVHNRGFGPQESRTEINMVKGLPWVGLGVGTWNTGSMVGSDLPALFEGSSYESAFQSYDQASVIKNGYRAGLSVQLPIFPRGKGFRLRAGLAKGQGKLAGEDSDSYGAVLDLRSFYFSFTDVKDDLKPGLLPGIETQIFAGGFDSGVIHLGYAHSLVSLSGNRQPATSQFSFRFTGEVWSAFASLKLYTSYRGKRESWPSLTLHRNFGEHFTFGYLYGLYRESHSLSLQVFL
jgi:hypothetical protein